MGLYSVSVASQNNTYYTRLNIVNFIDPIPAYAGMTKSAYAGMTKSAYDVRDGVGCGKIPLPWRGGREADGEGLPRRGKRIMTWFLGVSVCAAIRSRNDKGNNKTTPSLRDTPP